MSALEVLTGRLTEVTGYVGRNGSWRCPAHDDHTPSLTVGQGDLGAVIDCKAGCPPSAVMEALGLPMSALFDRPSDNGKSSIVASYRYVDEGGALLFEVVRYPNKKFSQRSPDGNGGWEPNVKGVRRVLYRLPDVLAAAKRGDRVFLVEGERDSDAIVRAGGVATTNAGGAGKWQAEYSPFLAGADVVIVVDKDKPGRDHAQQVIQSLREAGVNVEAIAVAKTGKDAADHLAAGHALEDFVTLSEGELDDLCCDDESPAAGEVSREPDRVDLLLEVMRSRLLTPSQLDQLPPPEPLIEGMLVLNTLAAPFGRPGAGKSLLAMDWGCCIATGTWWFGHKVTKGTVVYVMAEGSAGAGQRKRAWEQARNVIVTEGIVWLPMAVNLLDADWSEAFVRLVAELKPVLVIIDTLARSMPGGDENAPRDMSRIVDNADRVRIASGACVLLVHHTPKEGDTLRGHSSLEGAVDTAIEVKADGTIVTLKCAKQKDLAKFEPIRLHLRPVLDSAALYSHSGVGVDDELAASESALYEAMMGACGSDGLPPTALLKISGQAESTFYRAKNGLVNRGLIVNVGTNKQPRFTPKVVANKADSQ